MANFSMGVSYNCSHTAMGDWYIGFFGALANVGGIYQSIEFFRL